MIGDPDLPVITLGGITVFDAREWFPTKTGGAVVFLPRAAEAIEETAIHHDAVAFSGRDLNFNGSTVDEERARMQASYNWHTKFWPSASYTPGQGWNWPGMGYHLYAFPSGRIYLVGDILTTRAHVAYRNTRSTGIVGAGDFTRERPDGLLVAAYAQAAAWSWLVRGAELPLEGHRVWAAQNPPEIRSAWSTTCPGNTYEGWIPDVRRIAKIEYKRATKDPVNDLILGGDEEMKFIALKQEERTGDGDDWVYQSNGIVRKKMHRTADEASAVFDIPRPVIEVSRKLLEDIKELEV